MNLKLPTCLKKFVIHMLSYNIFILNLTESYSPSTKIERYVFLIHLTNVTHLLILQVIQNNLQTLKNKIKIPVTNPTLAQHQVIQLST